MHFSTLKSGVLSGLQVTPIHIEIDISLGLFSFTIVGLPDKTVEESKERILAAIKNSGFDSPKTKNHKIVVSLAPADTRKEGASLDLPIAISYLKASGEIHVQIDEVICTGELSLNGDVKAVPGILPFLQFVAAQQYKSVFIPEGNRVEAALISGLEIFCISNIRQLVDHLHGTKKIAPLKSTVQDHAKRTTQSDIPFIIGQDVAKRALEIAVLGGHSIILCGPPGTGKTLLAKSVTALLPQLSTDECIESTAIHSLIKHTTQPIWNAPLRSPHHTSTEVALLGGGTPVRPGELSLAHNGILFLDELTEFDRHVLESLREPLEEHVVRVARGKQSETYPARCILVAALNPCPCGYRGSLRERCTCTAHDVHRYQKKLSGPFLDRIDMWINVDHAEHQFNITDKTKANIEKKYVQAKQNIEHGRGIQQKRYAQQVYLNAQVSSQKFLTHIQIKKDAETCAQEAANSLRLSLRAYHKVLRLARSIADYEQSEYVKTEHVLEALSFRPKREF